MKLRALTFFATLAVVPTVGQIDPHGGVFGPPSELTRVYTFEAGLSTANSTWYTDSAFGQAAVRLRIQNLGGIGHWAIVQVDTTLNSSLNQTMTSAHLHRGLQARHSPPILDLRLENPIVIRAGETAILRTTTLLFDLNLAEEIALNPSNFHVTYSTESRPDRFISGQLQESSLTAVRRLEQRVTLLTEPRLRMIGRLVALMAYQQSIISAAERDALLSSLEQ